MSLRGKVERANRLSTGVMETLTDLQHSRVAERSFLQEGNPELAKQAEALLASAAQRLGQLREQASSQEVRQELETADKEVRATVEQIFAARAAMLQAGISLAEISRKKLVEPLTPLECELLLDKGTGLDDFFANLRKSAKETTAL